MALLEVEILNKVTNLGAIAEERTALSTLATAAYAPTSGYMMLGAPGSGEKIAAETKKAGAGFKALETDVKNAVILTGQAGALTDGLARKMSALGALGFTPASIGLIALVAGLGLTVETGKAAIDNYEQQQQALKKLMQAEGLRSDFYVRFNFELKDFIATNAKYIDNQYDVIDAASDFIRAGVNQKTTLDLLGDSLDLAAQKHISVSAASKILLMATEGNTRGLRDLGYTAKEVTAIEKSLVDSEARGAAIHELVKKKVDDERKTTTELSQSQKQLNKDWQDFTVKIAPGVAAGLDDINKAADAGVGILSVYVDLLNKLSHMNLGQLAKLAQLLNPFNGLSQGAISALTSAVVPKSDRGFVDPSIGKGGR